MPKTRRTKTSRPRSNLTFSPKIEGMLFANRRERGLNLFRDVWRFVPRLFAEPRRAVRFLRWVVPYFWHHGRKAGPWERTAYMNKAWRKAGGLRTSRVGMPLTVLGNTVDAPCEGCGGRCCRVPAGTAGFTTVVIESWEAFAEAYPELCEPSSSTPGQLHFHFDKLPDKSRQCRFLRPDGKCGTYHNRPLACRNFSCTDALVEDTGSCAGNFLNQVPEVKQRLLSLGFKEISHRA